MYHAELIDQVVFETNPSWSLADDARSFLASKIDDIRHCIQKIFPTDFPNHDLLHDIIDQNFSLDSGRFLFTILNRELTTNGYNQDMFVNIVLTYFISELIEIAAYDDNDRVVIPICKRRMQKAWKTNNELLAYIRKI